MTIFNQSDSIISAQYSHANLKYVYDIPRVQLGQKIVYSIVPCLLSTIARAVKPRQILTKNISVQVPSKYVGRLGKKRLNLLLQLQVDD